MANLGIYSQHLQPVRSVADYDREANAAAMSQLEVLAGRQKLDANDRAVKRQGALDALLRGGAGAGELRAGGFLDEAVGLEKHDAEVAAKRATTGKTVADTKTAEYDLQRKRFEHKVQGLTSMTSADDARQYLADGVSEGVFSMNEAAKMMRRVPRDDEAFGAWRNNSLLSIMDAGKQMGFVMPDANAKLTAQTSTANNAATNARVAAEGAANRAVQVRGQNLVHQRAGEGAADAREQRRIDQRAAADEKAVEKFSSTLQKEGIPDMETAVAGAEGALNKYKKGEVPGIGPVKNVAPDWLMSAEGKQVRQALATVRNIVLSARSGAAVTDQELRRLVEEIGTGVGKTEDEVRSGLGRIRERLDAIKTNAAAGVSDEVLDAYRTRGGLDIKRGASKPAAPGATTARAPMAGEVQDGYRFKGGNPSDPKNWERF